MTQGTGTNGQHVPLDDLLDHLNGLIAAFMDHPDERTRQAVFALLQSLDALHREAFKRLAAYLNDRSAGHLLVEAAQTDRLLQTALDLYDILPHPEVESRVEKALSLVRPYIESHGGTLNLLQVDGGVVHIEMGGACRDCPGSLLTVRRGVVNVLREHFSAFEEVVVHEPEPSRPASLDLGRASPGGLISFDGMDPSGMIRGPEFKSVAREKDLPEGAVRGVVLEGARILLARVDDEVYAVGEVCPGSMLPLSGGRLTRTAIACPWHGEQYDLRTGRCLDPAGRPDEPRLPVYPVALVDGEIRVAVNVPARPPVMAAGSAG
ncbi:MAG TPA: NifU family protein [Anaerolineales bacterium]|nr:NifU family protein [Anaerolineales bacterium]